jgi:maleylacetoacetate isomerase
MNIKGLVAETVDIDLIKGDQHEAAYKAVNPARAVPALILDDGGPPLFQSTAIMEYLEEVHPRPPILPGDPRARARVRALSQIVISDSHPLSVPRIRKYLTESATFDEPKLNAWIAHWQNEALRSLEGHLSRDKETGAYCHGDSVTMADICVASQGVAAGMFKIDMAPYPTVDRIVKTCFAQEVFAREHPLKQRGAPAGGHH